MTVRKQLLAETSSVPSLDDSVQEEAVAWPGPWCSMGAFSKRSKLCLVGGLLYDVGGVSGQRPLEVAAG